MSFIYKVACHTDNVGPNSTFVAINGTNDKGINYIPQALIKGAKRIVVQEDYVISKETQELISCYKAKLLIVPCVRKALAVLSAEAYNYPAKSLKIIGVTGTKGKTTTAYLLREMLKSAGYKTALISTVKNFIEDQEFNKVLTTPQADYLHYFFDLCRQKNINYVVLEVAAQAVTMHRIFGLEFDSLIFTNFSLEHSEFYSTLKDYFQAKCDLFKQLKPGCSAILNADDSSLDQFAKKLHEEKKRVITFGIETKKCDVSIVNFLDSPFISGTIASKKYKHKYNLEISSPQLFSLCNIYNILSAVSCVKSLDFNSVAADISDNNYIINALKNFSGVPGRFERFVLPNNAIAYIDYAHTPSSFIAVFSALRPKTKDLIAVFGAGGGKDVIKRSIMGNIASKYADSIILTSDNPRWEDPNNIINSIKSGIHSDSKVYTEIDREQAIRLAYSLSKPDSIIVILGKGTDEFQTIKNITVPFSESRLLRSLN